LHCLNDGETVRPTDVSVKQQVFPALLDLKVMAAMP
jgi:hypothetical protein